MSYTITEEALEDFKRRMKTIGMAMFFIGATIGFIIGEFF